MDQATLLWTVDATRGTVHFGRLMPFAGNTYELVFAGVVLEEVYTAYVMDERGLKCLAKSQHNAGAYTIAFNTADLRDEFERNMHEVKSFHVIVRDSKRVVAEGDLCVQWQSLWEDTTTGEVFTMKGDPGKPGDPGRKGDPGLRGLSAYEVAVNNGFDGSEEEWLKTIKGNPGSMVRIQAIDEDNNETGMWHDVYAKADLNGRLRVVVDKTAKKPDPSSDVYVSTTADMMVGGVKTFTESPVVPTIAGADGKVDVENDSHKAVNTKWIRAWWESVWKGIKDTTQTFSAQCTFLNGIVGNVKGDLDGTAKKASANDKGEKFDEVYFRKTAAESLKKNIQDNYVAKTDATILEKLSESVDGTVAFNGNALPQSYSSASWRVVELGDNIVMMWAHLVGNATYTLPLPMADASYCVFSAIDKINGGYNERHNITRTTTSFKVDSGDGVNGYIIIGEKA